MMLLSQSNTTVLNKDLKINFNNKNYTSVATNNLTDHLKDKGNELNVWKMAKALYEKAEAFDLLHKRKWIVPQTFPQKWCQHWTETQYLISVI